MCDPVREHDKFLITRICWFIRNREILINLILPKIAVKMWDSKEIGYRGKLANNGGKKAQTKRKKIKESNRGQEKWKKAETIVK